MPALLLKSLLILLVSVAFLAGSYIDVSKSALITNCLALSLALIILDSLWLGRLKTQPAFSSRSLSSVLTSYKWHPCWAWLALAIYMGIRISLTPNQYYLLAHGYCLIIATLGFIIGFFILFYRKSKPWLMSAWLWSLGIICLIQLIFCVIQLTVDNNFILHERFTGRESPYAKGTYFFEGGFGLFASLITSFLGAYILSQAKYLQLIQKIILILGFLTMLFLTFYSNSLTGMMVATLSLTLFPLLYYLSFISIFKRSRQWKWLKIGGLSCIVALTVAGLIWNQQLPIAERVDIKFLNAYDARLQYGDLALALIQEKPWFGQGARMYTHLYLTVYDGDSSIWHNLDVRLVHQEIIQLICDYGFIGFGLFLIALIWTLIYFVKLAKHKIKANKPHTYKRWLQSIWPFFILILGIFITTLGDFSLHYPNHCFLLGLSLGTINAWLKPIKNKDEKVA